LLLVVALGQWGCTGSELKLVDRKNGGPVCLELRSTDGRKLALDDVQQVTASGA
jgi:hypothetical protein